MRIDRLRVEGWVSVEQAAQIQLGQAADISIEIPNRDSVTKKGSVTFVSLEANPVDRKIRVWVEFENQDYSLRPGLRSNVTIQPSR